MHVHTHAHTLSLINELLKDSAIPTLVVVAFHALVASDAVKLSRAMRRFTTSTLPETQAACMAVSPEDLSFLDFCMEKKNVKEEREEILEN